MSTVERLRQVRLFRRIAAATFLDTDDEECAAHMKSAMRLAREAERNLESDLAAERTAPQTKYE